MSTPPSAEENSSEDEEMLDESERERRDSSRETQEELGDLNWPATKRYSRKNRPEINMAIFKVELTRFLEELSKGIPASYTTMERTVWNNLSIRYGLRTNDRGPFNYQKHRFLDCLKDERKEAPRWIRDDPEKLEQFNQVKAMFKEIHQQMHGSGDNGKKDVKPSVDTGDVFEDLLCRFLNELSKGIPPAYIEEGRKIWSNLARRYKVTGDSDIKQFNYEKHRFLNIFEFEAGNLPNWVENDPIKLAKFNAIKGQFKELQKIRSELGNSHKIYEFFKESFKASENIDPRISRYKRKIKEQASRNKIMKLESASSGDEGDLPPPKRFVKNQTEHKFLPSDLPPASAAYSSNLSNIPSSVTNFTQQIQGEMSLIMQEIRDLKEEVQHTLREREEELDCATKESADCKDPSHEPMEAELASTGAVPSEEMEYDINEECEDEENDRVEEREDKPVEPELLYAAASVLPTGEEVFSLDVNMGELDTVPPQVGVDNELEDAENGDYEEEEEDEEENGEDEEESKRNQGNLTDENSSNNPVEKNYQDIPVPYDAVMESSSNKTTETTLESRIRILMQENHALREELKKLKEKERSDKGVDTSDLIPGPQEEEGQNQVGNQPRNEVQDQLACAWKFVYEYRTKYDQLMAAIKKAHSPEQIRKDFPEIFEK